MIKSRAGAGNTQDNLDHLRVTESKGNVQIKKKMQKTTKKSQNNGKCQKYRGAN